MPGRLMEIATNSDSRIHLKTFSNLVGVQKGDNKGKDLIFMDTKIHYPNNED